MRKIDSPKRHHETEPTTQTHQFNCNRCERFLTHGERVDVNGLAYCLTCLMEVVDVALGQDPDDEFSPSHLIERDPPPTLH